MTIDWMQICLQFTDKCTDDFIKEFADKAANWVAAQSSIHGTIRCRKWPLIEEQIGLQFTDKFTGEFTDESTADLVPKWR